jgi:replication-associated recombination protein RarA
MDLHPEIKEKLDCFYATNKVPHLLFYGPHGSGKKTIVNNYLNKIFPLAEERRQNVMKINCALGKGIQFIRDEIKQFAKSRVFSENKFKIIMLYNADRLTVDAQSALRRCIEVFSHTTRFFVVVEKKKQLLRPILSRFCDIYVYFPIIEGKPQNLHLFFKNYARKDMVEYDTFLKNKSAQINRILVKCHDPETNLFEVAEDLYHKGYHAYDLAEYYKTSTEVKIYFHAIKEFYKSEPLMMVYLLYLIFRMKDNIEIFELM